MSALCNSVDETAAYSYAFSLYQGGNYTQATTLFSELVLLNPFDEKLWRGLASSRQMSQEYEAALQAWALVALLQESDPLPHFHAAECYLSLHDTEEAMKALDVAEMRAQNAPETYRELNDQIALLRRSP